jgi:hypothetical protein
VADLELRGDLGSAHRHASADIRVDSAPGSRAARRGVTPSALGPGPRPNSRSSREGERQTLRGGMLAGGGIGTRAWDRAVPLRATRETCDAPSPATPVSASTSSILFVGNARSTAGSKRK